MILQQSHKVRGSSNTCAALSVSLGLALVLAAPVEAASFSKSWKAGHPHCYTRSYDAKHLAAHPRQLLTSFKLSAPEPTAEPGVFAAYFSFTVKGDGEVYETIAECRDADARTVHCSVEGDGGHFSMRLEGPNLLLDISRISTEGEKFSPDVGVGSDDRLVRLFASPTRSCRFSP